MAKTLVISPEAPYPASGGGALRTASILEYLVSRGHEVDLVLFGIAGGWDPRTALPHGRFGSHLIELPPHSNNPAARIGRNALRLLKGVPPLLDRFAGFESQLAQWLNGRHYDIVILEHFWIAPYAALLRRHAATLILDLHNIESEWHRRMAACEPWPVSWGHQSFSNLYTRRERDLLPLVDHILTPAGPYTVYPNSIPLVPPPETPATEPVILFSGNFEYGPNRHAVRWFRRHVWPLVRKQNPGVRWRMVGKNDHAIAGELEPGIETTGAIADAVAELAKGQLAIVPILSGSGTRVKILEAWAAQLPVVSTSLGAEGLDAAHTVHLLLADTPEEFSNCVSRLLDDPQLRRRLGAAGRSLYENRYTWEKAWELLDALPCLNPKGAKLRV